ncbi:prolipoprotein diacylglyceryl transferase [bacterium]|nr:prolipoprotein diacylglyceryl transferase [bacterium]
MHPILFKIGPLTIYTYGLMIAVAFLAAIILAYYEAGREGMETARFADLGFFVIISGIIGARALYVLTNPSDYIKNPLKIIMIWEGGLIFYGGILAAMATSIFLLKKYRLPFWQTMDVLAPSLAIAQAIGRIGCFMAGCCYGRVCNLPWAVTFNNPNTLAPMSIQLHPTQLYHAFANLTVFMILFYILRKNRRFTGQIFCLYLCLYPIGRFLVEFFRGDSYIYFLGALNFTQGISIIIFLSGIYLYFYRNTSSKSQLNE